MSYPTKTDATKGFSLSLLKDIRHKDLQQNLKHSMVLNLMERLKRAYTWLLDSRKLGYSPNFNRGIKKYRQKFE